MSRTYQQLREQATLNFELFMEDIQNRGTFALGAVGYTGAPKFRKIGNTVSLVKTAAADGLASGNVASVLDLTGTVTFEGVFATSDQAGIGAMMPVCLRQVSATGGFTFGNASGVNRGEIYLLNAAGVGSRVIATSTGIFTPTSPVHLVMTSITGGTSGLVWINGTPSTVVTALAGVTANPAASAVVVFGAASFYGFATLARGWQGALDNAEALTLYQNYRRLVIPSKV